MREGSYRLLWPVPSHLHISCRIKGTSCGGLRTECGEPTLGPPASLWFMHKPFTPLRDRGWHKVKRKARFQSYEEQKDCLVLEREASPCFLLGKQTSLATAGCSPRIPCASPLYCSAHDECLHGACFVFPPSSKHF